MWTYRQLPGTIIDCTPRHPSEYYVNLYAPIDSNIRGLEIQEWIDKHNPEKYCIVDDDNDMLPHQIFVQTNGKYGLDKDTAFEIIKHLT